MSTPAYFGLVEFPGCHLSEEFEGLTFDAAVCEPKLDGYRLCALVLPDGVKFFSRSGKSEPFTGNLGHIGQQILDAGFPVGSMLDGEVMAEDFNSTALVRRKSGTLTPEEQDRLQFCVFDYIQDVTAVVQLQPPRSRLKRPAYATPLYTRLLQLAAQLPRRTSHVRRSAGSPVSSTADVERLTEEYLELGFEGAMVKDLDAPYFLCRSYSWQKVKPTQTIDARIAGAVEGEGKYVGMLGAFIVVKEDGSEFSVGGGFSDAERTDFWTRRESMVGAWLEVRMQAGEVSVARHPQFVRLRPDRE